MTTDHQLLPKDYQAALDYYEQSGFINSGAITSALRFTIDTLTRAASPSIPEGYALVPIEPTDAMIQSVHVMLRDTFPEEGYYPVALLFWKSMIAAAPQPPQSYCNLTGL